MKKIIALCLVAVLTSSLFAAVIPAPSVREQKSWVQHPGLLAYTEGETKFSIKAGFGSDYSGLRFMADPVGTLQKAASYLQSTLYNSSDQYLAEHYNSIANALSFDPGFPKAGNTDEETAYFIREYFKDGGRFDSLNDANKARAAVGALRYNAVTYPYSILRGGLTLDLAMEGGEVKNGLGWNWNVTFFFDGATSLFPQMTAKDKYALSGDGYYRYGNEFGLAAGGDIGYGTYLYEDKIAVGFSASPQIFFRSGFHNEDYLDGRLNGTPLSLLASNIFYLGAGIDLNLGALYRFNENIALSLDFRHIPSLQTYWYFKAEDFVDAFEFHHDNNFYFEPFDITLTAIFDYGRVRGDFGIRNVIDQLIVEDLINGYSFDYWTLFQFHVEYDLNDSLMLYLEYARRMLSFGVQTGGFTAELSTPLDRLGFAVSIGYEF